MSLDSVLKTLESCGLSRVESEVYIYLAKAGPARAKDLVIALKIAKMQAYSALQNLKKKGVVTSKRERTSLFSALAFEELVNRYVKLNIEQAEIIKEAKQELLDNWRNMTNKNSP